jgi:hydrogenase maturation protease
MRRGRLGDALRQEPIIEQSAIQSAEMIAVIGCGNLNRSDDGVGAHVIDLLRSRAIARPGVRLFETGTDGMAVMFAARGCRTLIVLDACQSGSPAGAIFEAPGRDLEQDYTPALNLHDFRWDHALHAGRKIFREDFPTDVLVLLIEVESVALGVGLSPPVSTAALAVADRVEALIEERLQGR